MIPKQFTILGHTYKIKQLKKIDKEDSWGEHNPEKQTITLKKGLEQEQLEQTYLHEVVHCILDHLSYPDLNDNEKFIDDVSGALYQILKTSKYEQGRRKRS